MAAVLNETQASSKRLLCRSSVIKCVCQGSKTEVTCGLGAVSLNLSRYNPSSYTVKQILKVTRVQVGRVNPRANLKLYLFVRTIFPFRVRH